MHHAVRGIYACGSQRPVSWTVSVFIIKIKLFGKNIPVVIPFEQDSSIICTSCGGHSINLTLTWMKE